MAKVFVQGLEFYAHHGVSEEERRVGHRFRLDLGAETDERARYSDDVADTLDYGELAGAAVEIASSCSCRTVERVVELIGAGLMDRYPKIERLEVRLAKLNPPLALQIEATGVERTFERTS